MFGSFRQMPRWHWLAGGSLLLATLALWVSFAGISCNSRPKFDVEPGSTPPEEQSPPLL